MSINEFRRLVTKMDEQQLAAEGVSEAHTAINRMLGHMSDLHLVQETPE